MTVGTQTMAYGAAGAGRDLRLDFLRGACLVKMVFAHLWITPVHIVNEWISFVTGAEGFFFISGAVVGIVYGKRWVEWGWRAASAALVERSLHLYLANLALVFFFVTLEVADILQLRLFSAHQPAGFAWPQLFTFDQPYYLHVLPRYVIFLLVTPLVLHLLRAGKGIWVVAIGVLLHTCRWWESLGGEAFHLPFLEGDDAIFPAVSWQLLFFSGVLLGYHRPRVAAAYRWLVERRSGVIALVLAFLFFVALRLALIYGVMPRHPLFLDLIDRQTVGYLRWLNLTVAFTFFFWLTDRFWQPLQRGLGWLMLPVGQNALYVFLLHIPLVWGAKFFLGPVIDHGLGAVSPLRMGLLLAVELVLMALLWFLVKRRFLFRVIPR